MSGQPHEQQPHDAHSFNIAKVKQWLLKGVVRIPSPGGGLAWSL